MASFSHSWFNISCYVYKYFNSWGEGETCTVLLSLAPQETLGRPASRSQEPMSRTAPPGPSGNLYHLTSWSVCGTVHGRKEGRRTSCKADTNFSDGVRAPGLLPSGTGRMVCNCKATVDTRMTWRFQPSLCHFSLQWAPISDGISSATP